MTVTEGAKTATKTHLESTYLYMGLGVGGDSTNHLDNHQFLFHIIQLIPIQPI